MQTGNFILPIGQAQRDDVKLIFSGAGHVEPAPRKNIEFWELAHWGRARHVPWVVTHNFSLMRDTENTTKIPWGVQIGKSAKRIGFLVPNFPQHRINSVFERRSYKSRKEQISWKIQTQFCNGVIFGWTLITDSEDFDHPRISNTASQAQILHLVYEIFASRENHKSDIHRAVKYAQQGWYKRVQNFAWKYTGARNVTEQFHYGQTTPSNHINRGTDRPHTVNKPRII